MRAVHAPPLIVLAPPPARGASRLRDDRPTPPPAAEPAAALMTLAGPARARRAPSPTATISYGADALQIVDLWLPAGRGPHPVVLMVHGGCWQTEIADRRIMNWIADDLGGAASRSGTSTIAASTATGGGYPGTFHDVAAAADALRSHAARYRSRSQRAWSPIGHSAGGHLALWLRRGPAAPAGR